MDENQTTDVTQETGGFEDFAAAFEDDSGYQTETEEQEAAADPEEPAQEPTETEETEDSEPAAEDKPVEEPATEPPEESEKPASEQMHTIKHNKGTEEVTYQELIARAQMGTDYPRVKEQRDQARQELQAAQAQLEQQQDIMGILSSIANKSGATPSEMMENLYVSMRKSEGADEALARAELREDKLQRQVTAMEEASRKQQTEKEDQANRAKREFEEFRKSYPDVEFSDELADRLMPDIQKGMTLLEAYRNDEMARKDAEIAALNRQLAAERQNKKNRAASPGSQTDSGGRRSKSDFADFWSAFD